MGCLERLGNSKTGKKNIMPTSPCKKICAKPPKIQTENDGIGARLGCSVYSKKHVLKTSRLPAPKGCFLEALEVHKNHRKTPQLEGAGCKRSSRLFRKSVSFGEHLCLGCRRCLVVGVQKLFLGLLYSWCVVGFVCVFFVFVSDFRGVWILIVVLSLF